MRPQTEHSRLMIAIIASVAAHALTIAALGGSYRTLGGDDPDAITAQDDPDRIRLGIETSDAQTVDWIGYEEYQKHIAPPAEQSQAQMSFGAPPVSVPSAPAEPKQEQSQPTIAELLLDQLFEEIANADFFAINTPAPEAAEPEPKPEKQKKEAEPKKPSPAAPPQPPTDLPEGNADKDADAVSSETDELVTEYTIGRPLAVEGLDIKTVRPVWSVRTTLLARPQNPRVRIHFDRDGKVALAQILQSSGEADVDRPLLNAVYQWRAVGDRLKELVKDDPDSTIAVTLTIRLR